MFWLSSLIRFTLFNFFFGSFGFITSNKIPHDNDLDFLVNFNLYNKKTFVGPIIATEKKVGQNLIVVDYNNKNILIPFAKGLISNIDKKKQNLVMDLPTGLLEI